MNQYTFTVNLRPSFDEYWEDIETLPLEKRIEKLRQALEDELSGWDCEVKNGTYYQMELDL